MKRMTGCAGSGSTTTETFEQAALALTAIVTDAPLEPKSRVEIDAKAYLASGHFADNQIELLGEQDFEIGSISTAVHAR